mgnify:CR=1 FL=1
MFPTLRLTLVLLRLLIPFFLTSVAVAAETSNPGLSTGNYLQAMLALAVIVGLLFGLAWLARKASGGKGFGNGSVKVIGGVALSPRERIVLIEVGDTWLVVGIVPGQIRTLHRLPKASEAAISEITDSPDAPFANWLKKVSERRNHD